MQPILNIMIREELLSRNWQREVPVFSSDRGTGKGLWTMDFRKEFKNYPDERVGIEVMFNHGEAMVWTMSRLDLANEAQNVNEGSRIDVGVVIVASDALKSYTIRKVRDGKEVQISGSPRDYKIDSAVGTYERLRTIIPKVRNFVKVPLLICTLYPEEGGLFEDLELITLDSDRVMEGDEWQGFQVPWDELDLMAPPASND